ncbi:M16 family metallopeptidase [Gillisia limnaea]|uniref:Peptidase M16 domain protein n=1 Tax=Gillisia limnaea (strain DSM 15749 / LMG 21470 / R-8282) TaxID=865937 RepID=H2BRZ3_GILLR|nr:peptidase M16 domain protein [Gillisia limnaea DSM 15749]
MKNMKNLILTLNAVFFLAFSTFAQIDRSKQPEAGPAPKINIQKPKTFTLTNGLQVMVVENHKLPRVSAVLIMDNPPAPEGADAGISGLTSSLLGTGTQKTSKDDFNEEIDFLGANVNLSAGSARANTLSKYFPRVLELMAEGALQPKFTQEELDINKQRQIEGLKSNEKDVSFNARRVRQALTYGKDHPYGELTTPESLENITLEKIQNYYNKNFVPTNAYLAIIGDVKFEEAKKLVEKHFATWKKSAVTTANLPEVKNEKGLQINFVDMPNAVQSEIAVVNSTNLKKNDPDYFAALVANQILGGGDGRLFLNLREDKGYTYGAYSSLGSNKYVSSFVASAQVRNAVTDSATVAFLEEIKRIRTEKVSEKELEDAKNNYTGSFVLSLEQPATIAGYALDIETENLPKNFYETYLQKLNAVTVEDVQRVANKYFKIDEARIIIAGKGSEISENLEKFTFNGKEIPVKYYNKKGIQVDKPEFNKAVDPTVTAESILNKYIQAIGGKQAVDNVESVLMTATAEIQGQKLDLEIKTTAKGKSLQVVSMGGNAISKQVFDGTTGFAVVQGQKIPFTEEQITDVKADAAPFPELIVKDARVMGIEAVDGKDAYAIALNDKTTAFYDMETGLKVKSVKTVTQGPQTMEVPTGYSNYQEVNGIKFPFTVTQSFGPQSIEFTVNEMKINDGVEESDFVE